MQILPGKDSNRVSVVRNQSAVFFTAAALRFDAWNQKICAAGLGVILLAIALWDKVHTKYQEVYWAAALVWKVF